MNPQYFYDNMTCTVNPERSHIVRTHILSAVKVINKT